MRHALSEILSGMLDLGRARERARAEAQRAEILPGGKVAIVTDAQEFATNGILFEEHGVKVIVYIDGYNLGIVREGSQPLRMDHPELRAIVDLEGETEEWFGHPAGFLYCRGSRKARAVNPSRVTARSLAEVAQRLLA